MKGWEAGVIAPGLSLIPGALGRKNRPATRRYVWRPEVPGRQALLVRAWTWEGPQDPTPRDPLPDGATGLHRVEVVVR